LLVFRDSERYSVLYCGVVTNGPTESFSEISHTLGQCAGVGEDYWVDSPLSHVREGELHRIIASYSSFVRIGVVIFCICSTAACNVPVVHLQRDNG
jgi:hypothetical protein